MIYIIVLFSTVMGAALVAAARQMVGTRSTASVTYPSARLIKDEVELVPTVTTR